MWCCGGRLSAFFFISHTNGFLSSFSLTLPAFYHRAAQIPCKAQPKSTHTNLNQKQITNTILQTRGVAGGFVWCCGGCFFFLLLRAGVLPFLFAACVLPFPPLLLRSFPFLFAACWRSSFSFCCVRSSFSFVAAAVVSFSFCCVLAFFLFLLLVLLPVTLKKSKKFVFSLPPRLFGAGLHGVKCCFLVSSGGQAARKKEAENRHRAGRQQKKKRRKNVPTPEKKRRKNVQRKSRPQKKSVRNRKERARRR